jgi:endonuclease-3
VPRVGRPRTPCGRARATLRALGALYPGTAAELCPLRHRNPFELLVATVLSAQTTDERVNQVTPELFRRFPTPRRLAAAPLEELERIIHPTGFFRAKAASLKAMAHELVARYGGEVPASLEALTSLPGVGRKTANVVRSVAFGLPGLPVDTHVARLSRRLGLASAADPEGIEHQLGLCLRRADWGVFSLRLILHGRRVCLARRPRCGECVLAGFCPSAFSAGA